MITKRQFAEQVRGLASRHSPDFNTPLAEIMLLVGQLRDEALVLEYLQAQNTTGEREILGELVNTFYDVPVRADAQRGREYVVLPARTLSLPGGRGLFAVFATDATGAEAHFYLVTPGTNSLLVNHPAATLFGELGCWPEAGRTTEPGRLWMKQATALLHPTLVVQQVVAAAHVGDDLPFAFPAHLQNRVRELAVAALLKQPREDRVADNVDQA